MVSAKAVPLLTPRQRASRKETLQAETNERHRFEQSCRRRGGLVGSEIRQPHVP
jgi:hypothetical protein